MNLPKLTGKLAGGTIELFDNRFALIKQCKNIREVESSNADPVYHYHIVKLAINGRGWCNGRYDLPDSGETILRFYSLAY